ncbi:DUF2252 domain-containing protein [Kushneria indalinina]|uniref:Uncharacterized protein (DUF2252 family) n=1 Tax=Kushneria indalinina DSM 14324 TaxID=1122140 RepID=A0A3D9DXR4_9GAMM|nr:DUF2252 family protein [Kushneria indalinina]REC95572.1 uncharacterized protein (DUF2252 family) [Kushneria indalinina DSM 14324]
MTEETGQTRRALYEQAQQRGIEGRSSMSKAELAAALEREGPAQESLAVGTRLETFRRLASAVADGEFILRPRVLTGFDRRLHVRQTLREDHQTRIADGTEETALKFDQLSDSLFSFFRGTALLFYRDMAGDDAWMPTVLALGDVHPENFGIMPNVNNVPIFSVNDFDEACYAPFTWDLKRGATGFMIAAETEGELKPKHRSKIVRHFIKGYIDAMARLAREATEQDEEMRFDNAPKLIRKLFKSAHEKRSKWLRDDYLDETGRRFRSSDKLVPITSRIEEFQQITDRLIRDNDIEVPSRARTSDGADMRVKDVAIRRGQGTASLGLDRYYVLIEGPKGDGTDDLIIEYKQARRSALTGLVPPNGHEMNTRAERISHAQAVHLIRGDRFYGHIEFDGQSYLSRERAPFRDSIDLDDLSKSDWKAYARICGQVLAGVHALSDEAGRVDYDIEPAIVEAIGPEELFTEDMVMFAEEGAERVRRDHALFQEDHARGAFTQLDMVYR